MLTSRPAERPWGAGALASVLTAAAFAALLSSAAGTGFLISPPFHRPTTERVDYVVPLRARVPASPSAPVPTAPDASPRRERPTPGFHATTYPAADAARADGSRAAGTASGATAVASVPRDSVAGGESRAIMPSPAAATVLLGPRAAHSVTGRGELPPRAVRDSINGALSASIPTLAARRKGSQGEVDEAWRASAAREREARREGRPMPAGDPTKAGAMMSGKPGTITISVPFLSPGPSKKQRMRDSLTWKTNKVLMQRLQARLDSIRADSARLLARPQGGVRLPDTQQGVDRRDQLRRLDQISEIAVSSVPSSPATRSSEPVVCTET